MPCLPAPCLPTPSENKDLKFRLVMRHSVMPERTAAQPPHEEIDGLRLQLGQLRRHNDQLARDLEEERAHHMSETRRRQICDHSHYKEQIERLGRQRDAALADVAQLRGTVEALELCVRRERQQASSNHPGGGGCFLPSLQNTLQPSSRQPPTAAYGRHSPVAGSMQAVQQQAMAGEQADVPLPDACVVRALGGCRAAF